MKVPDAAPVIGKDQEVKSQPHLEEGGGPCLFLDSTSFDDMPGKDPFNSLGTWISVVTTLFLT